MKRITFTIHFLLFFAVLLLVKVLAAQVTEAELRTEKYIGAIQNIISESDFFNEVQDVVGQLTSPGYLTKPLQGHTVILNDHFFFLSPAIDLVSYTGNEPAQFTYFASNDLAADTTIAVNFAGAPDWVLTGTLVVDTINNTITINVAPNLTGLARSASFAASAVLAGQTLSFTAHILQEHAPQQFIFVSPQFLALVPGSGTAGPFTVTHFNIGSWEAIITDSWVAVDSATLTGTSILFLIEANPLSVARTAVILVRAVNNPGINDQITLLQYPGTQSYIIASPNNIYAGSLGGDISAQVFTNTTWNANSTVNPGNMITQAAASANFDSLIITVAPNTGTAARMAKIALVGGNPAVTDTVRVYQSAAYILLNPAEKVAPCMASSFSADIINYNAGSLTISSQPSWASASISGGIILNVNVQANNTGIARTGTITVGSVSNPAISGSLQVIQYGCSQPYIIVSPAEQAASWHETQLASSFTVLSNNVETLGIIVTETWLTAELAGDQINVTLEPNLQNTIRTAQIAVLDVVNPEIIDIVTVIQGGTLAYILVSPEFRSVSYSGGPSGPFTVTSLGIDNWEVWFEEMPAWITDVQINGNQIVFNLALNDSPETRQAVFQVRDVDDITRFDEAVIFQKAAPEPFLFMAPRQKQVPHTGQQFVNFDVTRVNVETWEVDETELPDWISINPGSMDILSLAVAENSFAMTRNAVVRINDTSNPAVFDSVLIYQYSAADTFLLAAPRGQLISQNGSDNVVFSITAVNVPTWSIEPVSLPGWISANASPNQMILNVEANPTQESRQALIRIQADSNPMVYDSVYIYQYSALDTFLLAAPREQLVSHLALEIEFQVTTANLVTWLYDPATVPGWITISASGGNLLTMQVTGNTTLQTRQATVRLFSPQHPDVEDFVTVYQYAGPKAYLIAAPRERRVAHSGDDMVDFSIIRVNVAAWEFVNTTPYEDWIGFNNIGDSIIRLNVSANSTLLSRQAQVIIQAAGDASVRDTVSVYQYSALDEYLLASPREHQVQQTDTVIHYSVTAVNISENWLAEFIEGTDWMTVLNSGGDILSLHVEANTSYQTRSGKIRLFAQGENAAADTVSVYQFASPAPSILASPREQTVAHSGNPNLNFDVTRVNVQTWQADLGGIDWISIVVAGNDLLTLNVSENQILESRIAIVQLIDVANPAVKDSVVIYQYSALDSYILASPREKVVSYSGSDEEFHIISVNVANWVVETYPSWITPGNSTADTLKVNVSLNTNHATRVTTLFIADQNDPLVFDSVSIYQFASPVPHIIIAPREKKIAHTGEFPVDFDITLVNVDSWEFSDTITNSEWIDFYNIGDSILRLKIEENITLSGRSAIICIQSTVNSNIMDSISIYQYSALDHYILVEPREQLARSYSADTLTFRILSVNVDNLGFEVVDDPDQMIDTENSTLSGDTLELHIYLNENNNSRQARLRVFDTERPLSVGDTVSVYQNFPYIILRPAALDSIPWIDTIVKVFSYSNIGNYQVAGQTSSWYKLSRDLVSWTNDPLVLRGNDSVYMKVDTNNNAFLRRSSHLTFSFNQDVANQFWFDQNTRPGTFFSAAGSVFIDGDPTQPLQGVRVALYDSIKVTNIDGNFFHGNIPENWIGSITPLIDTALAVPFYFIPSRIEITEPGILENTIIDPFAAYKILPTVTIAPDTIYMCYGDTLRSGSQNYPVITISNTYGSISYSWSSTPFDEVLNQSNPFRINPDFGPKETTTYKLVINNFYRTDSAFFTIAVRQLPDMVEFTGPVSVCANQAGVVYQVLDPQPGVYYKWMLDPENAGGDFANSFNPHAVSGNIAIVDWGANSGNFPLHLFAFNQYDCVGDPVTIQIQVSNTRALKPTTVFRKANDNMLYCSDSLASAYQWGWFTKNANGELSGEYLIPDKNSWYCRLPDGHVFSPSVYYYFVITYHAGSQCGSRSFFNAPVGIYELQEVNFKIFPNPNHGTFTIRDAGKHNEPVNIEILNPHGRVVFNKKFEGFFREINVDMRSAGVTAKGVYMVRIKNKEQVSALKFIVH